MNYKSLAVVVLAFIPNALLLAQRDQGYQTLRMTSAFTSFPDSARTNGFLDGDSVFRPAAGHYDDSSVLLVTPLHPRWRRKVDLIFWFHGWHNNIDTALQFYGLARQFADSKCNAVLVLPEAAKNAADSYGGKLRRDGDFRNLVGDVMKKLSAARVVPRHAEAGHIVLACHSGGYSAVADILAHGQQEVEAVWLFDALYGRLPVFMDWIRTDKRHRFVHWFTNHGGGTDEMSDTLMRELGLQHTGFLLTDEASLKPAMIRDNRVLFIHSPRQHNVIINDPDDFELLLQNAVVIRCGGY
ncbi:MAG TPA: hypothetical protein VKU83_05085 [Puia sp.]|nr:hypothetical protein [Puia sp.]